MANENKDLKFIKKHYGEKLMHLCREMFPTLLEQEGLLSEVLTNTFAPTRSLYEEIENNDLQSAFKNLIFSRVDVEKKVIATTKMPEELLDEAGYILYPECQNEDEVQSFKKYYAPGEALCTFNGGRLNRCRVWFAVKKDVDKIRREDFENPQREDLYGTSVLSIQFTRGESSTLSIKNRYNHTVNNPDATFGNNLDNIKDGLTEAFTKTYGIDLISQGQNIREFGKYVLANDGKFYRSNVEYYGCNFCENNVMITFGDVTKFDPFKNLLMENYLLDLENKKITGNDFMSLSPELMSLESDAFIDSVGKIKNVKIEKQGEDRSVIITPTEGQDVVIQLNKNNAIVGYSNSNITKTGDDFLRYNEELRELSLPNVEVIGFGTLQYNKILRKLSLPKAKIIENGFLYWNRGLEELSLPKVETIEGGILYDNRNIKEIYAPMLDPSYYVCLIGPDKNRNEIIKHIKEPNKSDMNEDFEK